MKFLTPEIEALSKHHVKGKSLARTNISCGIFQDCDYNDESQKTFRKQND
ncbi:hypothetical protein L3X37_00480 [Sabulilitoribacter arenilitoris]|uniref:Uncharacterized protein n=1 Tax=Wocania arenilitoris TaxID=2044858 RepID=A0AAE3JLK1_9FLAO|nr:hypothetical protein [Wocania arenilitoris]MCF7566841.1 hypothetical protein [Wocania arenilitoris]